MSEHNELERAVRHVLSTSAQDQAANIAQLLIGIIQQTTSADQMSKAIQADSCLNDAISSLVGKEIKTRASLISIEQGSNIGDMSFGDIAQGNIIKITINVTSPTQSIASESQEIIRLRTHKAYFIHNSIECIFINLVNMQEKEIEVTHIWLEYDSPINILNLDRLLPKRLKPQEAWETWIEIDKLPERIRANPFDLVRAQLSTGAIIASQKNKNVPTEGFVPGGPITVIVQTNQQSPESAPKEIPRKDSPAWAEGNPWIQVQAAGITATDFVLPADPPKLNLPFSTPRKDKHINTGKSRSIPTKNKASRAKKRGRK